MTLQPGKQTIGKHLLPKFWLVNRSQQEKYFPSKIMQKMG